MVRGPASDLARIDRCDRSHWRRFYRQWGAGSSRLVDCLLEQGFRRITVLDLSETALAKARARLPEDAPREWVVANVLDWKPSRPFDVWHDRAAFHFLTEAADQDTYLKVLNLTLVPSGHAIIGTFSSDGPTSCSGLPVARYDAALLSERLGNGYYLVKSLIQDHHMSGGNLQRFHFGCSGKSKRPQDRSFDGILCDFHGCSS